MRRATTGGGLYNQTKKQGARTDLTSPQNEDKSKTSECLAVEHGVSARTIENDGQYAAAVDKPIRSGVRRRRRSMQSVIQEQVRLWWCNNLSHHQKKNTRQQRLKPPPPRRMLARWFKRFRKFYGTFSAPLACAGARKKNPEVARPQGFRAPRARARVAALR